jgi:hypothetical protein
MSVKNPNDPLGNQTIDLPTCSPMPQPNRVLPAQSEILLNSKHQLQVPKCKVFEKIQARTFFAAVKQVLS